jgi:general stress protein 26
MDAKLLAEIQELIERSSTLALATLREDGWPQTTSVAYASHGLTLYVATGADAQKVRNIRRDSRVSLAEFSDPERDRGWAFLRLEPKVVSLIDYTKGFGHTVLVKP